jgi:hypothetical protein
MILLEKPKGKSLLGRRKSIWEDNIKTDFYIRLGGNEID